MKVKNIVIAFIVLVAAIALLIWYKKSKTVNLQKTNTPSITQQIENKFANINIPEDAEKVELKDVTGGSAMGIATRTEILADLPEATSGIKYWAWLEDGSKKVLLGALVEKKGGWIIEYNSSKYPGYNKVVIKEGTKALLEGSF
jgi:hypothetical protein